MFALVAQRAHRFLAHVFATRRSGAVSGIDNGVVGQRHQLVAQAVVQVAREVFDGELAFWPNRPPHVAQKQGVSGEHGVGVAVFVAQQVGRAFHGVARGVQHLNLDVSKRQALAVGGHVRVEIGRSIGPKDNGRSSLFREGEVARHKVCVEVRLQYVLDGGASFVGQIDVRLHFAQRIDNGRFSVAFNIVRALGKASGVNLFDFHGGCVVRVVEVKNTAAQRW